VTVASVDLPLAEDMKVVGVVLDRRLTFDRHVTAVAIACNYHAWVIRHISHLLSRTRCYSDLQPDTVSAGLLQRCVVWCSRQQYSEAAACPEHCGEDRHTVAKKGKGSTTAGTVTLASCSSTDRVQAGRTDIQDPSFINPSVTHPSHQIASNFTSSSFLRHAFTAQTYYQNSLC